MFVDVVVTVSTALDLDLEAPPNMGLGVGLGLLTTWSRPGPWFLFASFQQQSQHGAVRSSHRHWGMFGDGAQPSQCSVEAIRGRRGLVCLSGLSGQRALAWTWSRPPCLDLETYSSRTFRFARQLLAKSWFRRCSRQVLAGHLPRICCQNIVVLVHHLSLRTGTFCSKRSKSRSSHSTLSGFNFEWTWTCVDLLGLGVGPCGLLVF